MDYTSTLNLKKPTAETDYVNVEDINENMDTIDAAVSKLDTEKADASDIIAIDDQEPTYTKATTLTEMVSGETHTTAFGKIAKAVSSLISHLANSALHITSAERTAWNEKADAARTVNGHALTEDVTVSASDVGLGNVPNVSTNNQTPTYSASSVLAALVSGEVLSTTLGKISKAISTLITSLVNPPWVLIKSYTTAGTYTFTAPDLFNGASYIIAVRIVGAGGSGGAAACSYYGSTSRYCGATGGASGYATHITLTVTPASTYTVVVGAGGVAVSATCTAGAATTNGSAGGTSSFNGTTASGGNGGTAAVVTTATLIAMGADGGQGSSLLYSSSFYGTTAGSAPAMGVSPVSIYTGSANYSSGLSRIMDALNMFTGVRSLGAGAAAWAATAGGYNSKKETVSVMEDGLTAGAAGTYAGTATSATATATAPTSPGSGGGAAAMTSNATTTVSLVATSSNGADGAVFMYARKAAA